MDYSLILTSKHKFVFSLIAVLIFSACSPNIHKSSSYQLLTVDAQIPSNSAFDNIIAPYKESLDAEMNAVIAISSQELPKGGSGETALGNFVADLQKEFSQERFNRMIDISVINNGGLRNSLPKGEVTVGNIFELAPFENFIYILELKPEDVKRLAEYAVKVKNLGIAGMYIESENNELKTYTVNGNKVEKGNTYLLAINDYLANGGDRMDFLIDLPRIEASNILMREMLLSKIKELTDADIKISSKIEGRQKLN